MRSDRIFQKGIGALLGAVMVTLLLAAGCDKNQPAQVFLCQGSDTVKSRRVMVAPFLNWSTNPKAGLIVSELAALELNRLRPYKVIDPTEIQGSLKVEDYSADSSLEQEKLVLLAQSLSADLLLWGTVSEYAYRPGLYDQPTVGVNMRLIEVSSGRVLWAAGKSAGPVCLAPCDVTLSQLARDVCAELIASLR